MQKLFICLNKPANLIITRMKPKDTEPILALRAKQKTSENVKKVNYSSIVHKLVVHFCRKIKLLLLTSTNDTISICMCTNCILLI